MGGGRNACQPQKLIDILGSEPWLLIKTVAYEKFSATSSLLLIGPTQNCNMFHLGKGTANVHGRVAEPVVRHLIWINLETIPDDGLVVINGARSRVSSASAVLGTMRTGFRYCLFTQSSK